MDQMKQHCHADKDYEGGVAAASAHAQQAAAGVGKKHDQEQKHADDGDVGSVPAASVRAKQEAGGIGKKHGEEEEQPASSLNPTAARLLREAIVSQPDGGGRAAVSGSSDILAFARAVDRVDSPLE